MEGIMALVIPIIALTIPIVAIWTTHQRKLAELNGGDSQALAAAYEAKLKALEDRVRVLERIATDKSGDLSAQIEALRGLDSLPQAEKVN